MLLVCVMLFILWVWRWSIIILFWVWFMVKGLILLFRVIVIF